MTWGDSKFSPLADLQALCNQEVKAKAEFFELWKEIWKIHKYVGKYTTHS